MKVKEIIARSDVMWIPPVGESQDTPEVSVILPTFRRAKNGMFERAVQSVLNQDLKNIELIIVDDASTDGTAELIAHFMKIDSRVSCIRHGKNIGLPAISEYEGYLKAHGQYIAFIFDDNTWERDYLSQTISCMVRNHVLAAYGQVRSHYGEGGESFYTLGESSATIGMHSLCATNHIANGGVVLARKVIEDIGLYDPHVTLTRLCDWDLWKRIARKYEFLETGILAGDEWGASQKDSLGNSYAMDGWAAAERETSRELAMLQPQNFDSVDVSAMRIDNTQLFIEAVCDLYRRFQAKNWYEKAEIPSETTDRPRILVVAAHFDASTELSFGRICKEDGLIFRFAHADFPVYEIVRADVVVLVRNPIALDRYKRICAQIKIPCYLYLDDNFIELLRDDRGNHDLRMLCAGIQNGLSNEFSGLLVSTTTLESYCTQKGMNRYVTCIEPCIDKMRIKSFVPRKQNETVVFAYMGGLLRDRVFLDAVIPAISRMSEQIDTKVVYPKRINIDSWKNSKIEFIGVEHSFSLNDTLTKYGNYGPHFLLHPGASNRNNIYKTENALINAVQLGVPLIASALPPYESADKSGYCICADNTVEAWYEAIYSLLNDEQRRRELYECAKKYCIDRYSQERTLSVLNDTLSDEKNTTDYEIICRMKEALHHVLYVGDFNHSEFGMSAGKMSRSLVEVPLHFSGGLSTGKTYRITCPVDYFSELGICFASLGEVHGKIKITIAERNNCLRECTIDMEDFVHDNWTYVEFDPIQDAKGKQFNIRLQFEYTGESSEIGVIEDDRKYTLLYRILRKLGYSSVPVDLLFTDCR